MKYTIKWIFLIMLVYSGHSLWAQSTCSDQLRLAQRRYESGLLEEIPNILASCLERGFTREEKTNAYKLLIQAYIFSDQMAKADEMMLRFLRDFPEYTILTGDQKEFIDLYNTYRTEPIMKIEASLGTNFSMPWIKEYYGPEDLNTHNPKYSSNTGFTAEVNYINNLFGDFDGSFGFSLTYIRIGYFNEPFGFTSTNATYNSYYVGLPLALRYNRNLFGLDFFAKGGFEPVYLVYSNINFNREIVGAQDPITGNEDVTLIQRRFDIRPILSVGLDYKFGNSQLLLTAGFKLGTVFPTESTMRYANDDLYQKYYYIPDDFLIHQGFVSLSYVFSIYKPKKIR